MTKVLITGGTGFIGSALVRALVEQHFDVTVFDNDSRGNISNLGPVMNDITLIDGDIRDASAVSKAVAGQEIVYHLAFINGTENFYHSPGLVLDVGIRGHLNIMDACCEHRVDRFVFASSSEVYQKASTFPTPEAIACLIPDVKNPRFSYAGAKILGELLTLHYMQQFDFERIIFRPHNIYGPSMGFEHVIPNIIEKIFTASDGCKKNKAQINIQGTGNETRAFCHISDAVDAILLAGEKGHDLDIYNIGVSEEVTISSLILKIALLMEIEVTQHHEPSPKGGTDRRCPDITQIATLGYRPKISLNEGLKNTVEWYVNYFKTYGVKH